MTQRARPTLRCLREDLAQDMPRASTPLDEIDHPLLAKATERFTESQTPRERIAAIDDQVFFKVKIQRWRGAVWVEDGKAPWLVAAGHRQEGSPDDFYAALAVRGKAARRRYNAEHPSSHGHQTYTQVTYFPSAKTECAGRPSPPYVSGGGSRTWSTPWYAVRSSTDTSTPPCSMGPP
jgi:hypothetical protein